MIETPVGITNEKETSPLDLAPDRKGRRQALLRFFLFMGLAALRLSGTGSKL